NGLPERGRFQEVSESAKAVLVAGRRRTRSPGVVPSIRRTVRVRWAASAKPARCAAWVTVAPFIISLQASCNRSQRTYGRTGTPTDRLNTCMNRDGDSPAIPARYFKLTVRLAESSSRNTDKVRRILGWSFGIRAPWSRHLHIQELTRPE